LDNLADRKRRGSKKQEIFQAKPLIFAVSQATFALHPRLKHLNPLTRPDKFGALLPARVYRDENIGDMFEFMAITDDMVLPSDSVVPAYIPDAQAIAKAKTLFCGPPAKFKRERASDFVAVEYVGPSKKRTSCNYAQAKVRFKAMQEQDDDSFAYPIESGFIFKSLQADFSAVGLFNALNHYSSIIINRILDADFKFSDVLVCRGKSNLMVVCELLLNKYDK